MVCTLLDSGPSVERPGVLGLKVPSYLELFARDILKKDELAALFPSLPLYK